jgi:5-methylcytosine-specific restriction endonuclease McrA
LLTLKSDEGIDIAHTLMYNKGMSQAKSNEWKYLTQYLTANKISYKEYLLTDHWKDVRNRFWKSKLHHYKCYVCEAKQNLQVHHKSYKRIGKEKLNDLVLLCGNCHNETHQLEAGRTNGLLWGAARRLRKNLQLATQG